MAPHFNFADIPGGTDLTMVGLRFNFDARHWLTERTWFADVIRRTGIVGQNHTDLGRAVHAAQGHAERRLGEGQGFAIDRFTSKTHFLQSERNSGVAILHHPVMRGGGGEIGDPEVPQRRHQTLGVETS